MLEPIDNENDDKYRCMLVDRKNNKLNIDYPTNVKLNRTAYLLTGMQMKATFIAEDGSVYLFETEIIGREKIDRLETIILSYPGKENLIKIQRREFVRVETSLDVAVHSLKHEFDSFTTVTDDISAGGAAIILPEGCELKEKQDIKTYFVIPMQSGDYHYLEITSRVIRIIQSSKGRNKASLQFLDLTENEEQIIIRLCFERQLALRRRLYN